MFIRLLFALVLMPTLAHADLKQVDWANHAYDFTRFMHGGSTEIRLKRGRAKANSDSFGRFTLRLTTVHYGDLTGDQRLDAVVELKMRAPTAADHTNRVLVVFEEVGGKPVQRGGLIFYYSGHEEELATLRFSVGPGRLEVTSPDRPAPGIQLLSTDHWIWAKRTPEQEGLAIWDSRPHAYHAALAPARRVRGSKADIERRRARAIKAMASPKGRHMKRASQLWMQIIQRAPGDAAAWSGLARSLVALKSRNAEHVIAQARRLNPDDLPLLHAFVQQAERSGDDEGLAEVKARIATLEAAKKAP